MERLEIFVTGKHEFTYTLEIKGDEEIHTLYYADNEIWTEVTRGKIACQLIDDGNGYKILPKNKGWLDYSDTACLKYLMDIATKTHAMEVYQKREI